MHQNHLQYDKSTEPCTTSPIIQFGYWEHSGVGAAVGVGTFGALALGVGARGVLAVGEGARGVLPVGEGALGELYPEPIAKIA